MARTKKPVKWTVIREYTNQFTAEQCIRRLVCIHLLADSGEETTCSSLTTPKNEETQHDNCKKPRRS